MSWRHFLSTLSNLLAVQHLQAGKQLHDVADKIRFMRALPRFDIWIASQVELYHSFLHLDLFELGAPPQLVKI